jgi:hypothetical protein
MALARIITRSHAYARELTLDLLARGYAVEIVSPDKIPDNFADLELRVDASPGDQLIASVVIRRSPEPREATHFPEEPVSFHAEPGTEDVELHAALPQLAPGTLSVAAETLHEPELDAEAGARRISPLDTFLSLPVEPPIQTAEENSTSEQAAMRPTMVGPTMVPPTREPQPFHRPPARFWRAGLTFASVMLLALVLAFGMRRSGKAPAQNSGAVSAEKIAAASTDVNLLSTADPEKDTKKDPGKDPGQVAATPVPPPAIKSQGNSDLASEESRVAKTDTAAAAATPAASARAGVSGRVSRRHGDDLIAPDTVTYLDKHAAENAAARAKLAKDSARRHPSLHERSQGVVAADTFTDLSNTSAPKAAKPDSGVEHPSNLN